MTRHIPPVPPAGRSPKGPGGDHVPNDAAVDKKNHQEDNNLSEQGRQGNIHQNTTNQGYQQDR